MSWQPHCTAWKLAGASRDSEAAMAANAGAELCPANFSAAADRRLHSFQEGFLWPILVAEFLVAMAGNSLALYRFVTREQRPWQPAVVFSVQLAVCNLCYALTLPPLVAYFYPPKNWGFGEVACRLERFASACNLLGGVIFITCISLNRYLGVVHPFLNRSFLRPKHAWVLSTVGWTLAVLLAAPTLSFSHLKMPQTGAGVCSVDKPEACIKCLETTDDQRLESYKAYGLVLAGLGGMLPLALTLLAYCALCWAVLRSHGMTWAQKLRVGLLVASGVALYACSYAPYHVMQVLNVGARRRWLARCPSFSSEAQAVGALELGLYHGYQVARILVPLATCMHPLLYMAVSPSLYSCCPHSKDNSPNQDLPLPVTSTS